MLYRWS